MVSPPDGQEPANTAGNGGEALDRELDRLFALPLAEFVAARNAAAKQWKRRDTAVADQIKSLPKPSVSAWTVNALWWNERSAFEALLLAGDQMRAASSSGAGPTQLQSLGESRRTALKQLAALAEATLAAGGHAASTAVMRKVMTSLEACAAHGTQLPAPGPGRLCADLGALGFGFAAGLAASGGLGSAPSPPTPTDRAGTTVLSPGAARLEARWREQLEGARAQQRTRARVLDEATAQADALDVEREAASAAHVLTRQILVDAQRAEESARHRVSELTSRAQRAESDRASASADLETAQREVAALERKLAGEDVT